MISRIVRLNVEYPFLTLLFVIVLILGGAYGYARLPVDAIPDVTNVQVQVLTSAPGLSPMEVERLVTRPVEIAMTGIPHTARIRSVSRSAVSAVTIVFEDDTDLNLARQLVSQRLADAREAIPPNAGRPALGPMTTGLGEVYHFTLRWPGHTLRDVRTLFEWEVAPRLKTVPGVVEVNAWGGDTRQVQVRLREASLLAAQVTPDMVERAVMGSGVTVSAGFVQRDEEGTFLRAEASYRTLDDIAKQVVTTREGRPVLVGDVAEVTDAAAPRFAVATEDGQGETVYAMAQMIIKGNAYDVVRDVKTRLAEIRTGLPKGVVVEPFYDRADFVRLVLSTVQKNLVEGGVIVALVLLWVLGSWRAGLLVASIIPIAMLGAFSLMYYGGVSGDLLSLGAIDFGLVVDGAVFLVEGVLASMAAHQITAKQAMGRVALEVGKPVTMAVLIIAIVYVPVLLLVGVEGKMFRPMALTVLFAMAFALVLTFTWIPAAGAVFLKPSKHHEPRVIGWLRERYVRTTAWLARRHGLVVVAVVVTIATGVAAGSTLGAEFVPRLEEGSLAIQVTRPPSVSLAEAARGTSAVEAALRKFPDVAKVVSRTGSPDVATDVMGVEQSDVLVMLKPRNQWVSGKDAASFAEAFEPEVKKALPGAVFSFTQPIEMRVQELIGGVRSDVGVKLFGDDLDVLQRTAEKLSTVIAATPGAADVRIDMQRGLRVIDIKPDPRRTGRLGIPTADVLSFTELLQNGRSVGVLREGQRSFDVALRVMTPPSPDPDPLRKQRIVLEGSRTVLLGDVAELEVLDLPAQISREQGRRRVTVEANVRGRDLASFVTELRQRVAKVELPSGYFVEYGGQFENLKRASERLALVVPLTLGTILVMLYLTFGRLRPALLIYVNIPVAAVGGILALKLRGLDLSISAAIGFLALFGVAVLNGVVLMAAIHFHEAEGQDCFEAITRATGERFRAILTTALVAALGFVPMAIAKGVGAEVQRPLATVVIGGLVTCTLVTLLALPTLYLRFGGRTTVETPD
ncbi:MAG: CusA/CzcA family heavy metal efflux RND transporter [Polyangiaceae bacterium]